MKEKLEKLLVVHLMRSVSERYSLLLAAGLSVSMLSMMVLEGPSRIVASSVTKRLENYDNGETIVILYHNLKNIPLPQGIPAPEE